MRAPVDMKKRTKKSSKKETTQVASADPAFLDAWAGPLCKGCGRVRTKNPSGKCARCLGPRCCRACFGRGWRRQPPVGCKRCSGKGTLEPLPASASEGVARVVPEGDKWVVELFYEGRVVRVVTCTDESIAHRIAERGKKAIGNGVSGIGRGRRLTETL